MLTMLQAIKNNAVDMQKLTNFLEKIESFNEDTWKDLPFGEWNLLDSIESCAFLAKTALSKEDKKLAQRYLNELADNILEYCAEHHPDIVTIDHMRYKTGKLFEDDRLSSYALLGDSIVALQRGGKTIPAYQAAWLEDSGEKMIVCVATMDDNPEIQIFGFTKEKILPLEKSFTPRS